MATGQTVPPLQPGAPGYSPSSEGPSAPEPEGGAVENNTYTNHYFGISYPLLADWREDYKGPPPSAGGYYVLSELRSKGELNGTVLIAAQDTFFGPPTHGPLDLLKRREKQAILATLKIESPPHEVTVGDRTFARLDYSGAGLHNTVFATDIRCHVITFEITTRHPDVLDNLVRNMANLTLPRLTDPAKGGGEFPVCVKDYATGANVIHQVAPKQVGPKGTEVPVRIIIDREGKIKHIHIINALPIQAESVKDALMQWTFKPYLQNGQPVEIETGILFKFSGRGPGN